MSNSTDHDPATPADAVCVERCLAGDAAAYTALVERHLALVYSIVLTRSRYEEAVAEELTQEVFMRAWLQLAQITDGNRFGAWVARIARNMATDWYRKSKRTSSLVKMIPLDQTEVLEMPAEDLSPREAAARVEASAQVRGALKQLPLEMQELLWLHYVEGVSQSDIARQLRVHPSTVKRKLERGAALLREKYRLAPGSLADALPAGDGAAENAHDRQRLTRTTLAIIAAASLLPQAQKVSLAKLAEQSWPTPAEPSFSFQQLSLGGQIMTYAGAAAVVVAGVAALMWWQPGAGNAEAVTGDAGDRASQTVVTTLAQGNAEERVQAHRRRVEEVMRRAEDVASTPTAQRGVAPKPVEGKHDPRIEPALSDDGMMVVKGRVVDDNGQPVEEVQIYLSLITVSEHFPYRNIREFSAREHESFQMPQVHAGLSHTDELGLFHTAVSSSFTKALVYTDHPPYVRTQELIDLPAENITIKLTEDGGATLRGRVVMNDEGTTRGVANARIMGQIQSSYFIEYVVGQGTTRTLNYMAGNARLQSGEDGYFEIDRVAVGTAVALHVKAEEGVRWPGSGAVPDGGRLAEAKVYQAEDVVLFGGYTLTGIVRDRATREPIEGAEVAPAMPFGSDAAEPVYTDAEGRYRLTGVNLNVGMPEKETTVGMLPVFRVSKEGYGEHTIRHTVEPPFRMDDTVIEQDVELGKGQSGRPQRAERALRREP